AGHGAVHPRGGAGGRSHGPTDRGRSAPGIAWTRRGGYPAGSGRGGRRMTWCATVLTIFPEMLPGPLAHSLAGKALKAGLWRLETVDIRDFARDKHRSVDDAPFGGGPGMVLRPDVLDAAIEGGGGAGPLIHLSPR